MLSSLLRPKNRPSRAERHPLLFGRGGSSRARDHARPAADSDSSQDDEEDDDASDAAGEDEDSRPLLPIFSAAHLDQIPVYHLQHSIRILIVQKCESTLSWDQLRSPQISQFLVKPILQQIRTSHTSRATLCALLANCLQFQKEGQMNPGTVGVSRTRAIICELLAMRLLRESSTRELIDALFYDFDPLQGLPIRTAAATPLMTRTKAAARISTVEIAIRAHAKRFLAHPLVVQQLEAVWAGSIVFHSAADTLHRLPSKEHSPVGPKYGAAGPPRVPYRPILDQHRHSGKGKEPAVTQEAVFRRSVTLYDPSHASLFKLSRLRVPRYRQLFSTLSYAIMLGLFLAVLVQRSLDITGLELIFWFWSAGYMLDEVVGFSEQGFGLYIMSVWNAFDIGILLLFILYYVLRLYGILMPDVEKRNVANMAYDVLASTAVLLFPRLFSVLDHYRYFSQLLIAFRMMAVDLAAILILIVISCSGFFVAFTLSFSGADFNAASAAYALFQIVMGFTPAAWELWADFSILGKALLSVFLIICHFLIVTILITVLTNSFMAIVQNANEEHQFLFAVNTISMVKSDALFSYIAPTNILGWLLSPLRFIVPLRRFVRLNRTVIKLTHIPILLSIFLYERLVLNRRVYEPMDLVEQRGRQQTGMSGFTLRGPTDLFSPGTRLREPSVATFYKDRALEEVFRRPFQSPRAGRGGGVGRAAPTYENAKSTNIVQDWMYGMGREGGALTPEDQPRAVLEQLEGARPGLRRHRTTLAVPGSRLFSGERPVVSEPEEPTGDLGGFYAIHEDSDSPVMSMPEMHQPTDADGDDELATNEDEEGGTVDRSFEEAEHVDSSSEKENRERSNTSGPSHKPRKPLREMDSSAIEEGDNSVPATPRPSKLRRRSPQHSPSASQRNPHASSPERPGTQQRVQAIRPERTQHIRTTSSATILFAPLESAEQDSAVQSGSPSKSKPSRTSGRNSGVPSGAATPRRNHRGIPTGQSTTFASGSANREDVLGQFPLRQNPRAAPNLASFLAINRRKPSFNAMALDLASDLGDNRAVPDGGILSGSWGTQMEMAAVRQRQRQQFRPLDPLLASNDEEDDDDGEFDRGGPSSAVKGDGDTRRLNRIMLARMTTMEETFREVLREVKGLNQSRGASVGGESEGAARERKRSIQPTAMGGNDGLGEEGRSSV